MHEEMFLWKQIHKVKVLESLKLIRIQQNRSFGADDQITDAISSSVD